MLNVRMMRMMMVMETKLTWRTTEVRPAARQTERAAELPRPAPRGISLDTRISMGTGSGWRITWVWAV